MCKIQVIFHRVSQTCIILCAAEQLLRNNRTLPLPNLYHRPPQHISGLNSRMVMSQNRQNVSRKDTQCMLKSTDVYAAQTTVLSAEAKRGKTEPLSTLYHHRSDGVRESSAQLNLSHCLAQSADQRDRGYHWKRMKCREERGENRERERERERESFPFIVLELPPHPLMPHLAKTLFVHVRCECRPSYKLLSYLDDKRNHIRDCFACSTAVKRQRERGEGEV